MEKSGAKVFGASYDTWRKQTVTLNTIGLHRGYMGHEMLGELNIINMNQRLLSQSGEVTDGCMTPFSAAFSVRTTMCRCLTTARTSTATAIV